MSQETTAQVRARLQEELRGLLIQSIESKDSVGDALVGKIVTGLEPQLKQQVSITLDDDQLERLAASIAEKRGSKRGSGTILAQLGQAGMVMAALIAALGIAMLVLGASLAMGVLGAGKEGRSATSAGVDNISTSVVDPETTEGAWKWMVGQLVQERNVYYKQHAALICGVGKQVSECQSYDTARLAWLNIDPADATRLANLRTLQDMIVKEGECEAPAAAADDSVPPAAAAYVSAIEACLTSLKART